MTPQKRHQAMVLTHNFRTTQGEWSFSAVMAVATLACLLASTGCKTGTTSFAKPSKPSWMNFGGTPKADPTALASAPPYSGDIPKPSDSAKPYPTTSTPSGYVITGSASPAATSAAAIGSAQPQAPVVYGSTPPATVVATPAMSPAYASQQPSAAITPQVGPYASLTGDSIPPPGQPLPPIALSTMPAMSSTAATSLESALPAAASSNYESFRAAPTVAPAAVDVQAARMADARASDSPADGSGGSRYSASTGSRFVPAPNGSSFPAAGPAAASASFGFPAEMALPASPAAAPSTPAPAGMAPPTAPGLLQPSGSQPVRRSDPVYRPGGTSSYRPSRTILAADSDAPAAIRPASFEEPAAGTILQ